MLRRTLQVAVASSVLCVGVVKANDNWKPGTGEREAEFIPAKASDKALMESAAKQGGQMGQALAGSAKSLGEGSPGLSLVACH